jgi:hypothetical protein
VGLLDSFERGIERVVNGAFAKTFKSGLQPVEITAALKREIDTKAAVVARDRILVPNSFSVRLGERDHTRMAGLGPTLIDELTQQVTAHATRQGYQFAGPIAIALSQDSTVAEGVVRIESSTARGRVTWTPVLEINGTRHPIVRSRTVIGRGSDADITVDDSSISRKHVEIAWDGSKAQVRDLGSTNGSSLNGAKVTTALLEPDSVVTIGRTRIVFKVLAQSAADETR